ncbi:Haloacid Dehalogenase-Like Hydrolase Domain-Containing 5 [Manis pentadactyla]|nr:Haloacid Dehalogenase-Like Hydrolase Domain-Containing 5 [Manis pentadactyla]
MSSGLPFSDSPSTLASKATVWVAVLLLAVLQGVKSKYPTLGSKGTRNERPGRFKPCVEVLHQVALEELLLESNDMGERISASPENARH